MITIKPARHEWARALLQLGHPEHQKARDNEAIYRRLVSFGAPRLAVELALSGGIEPCEAIAFADKWALRDRGILVFSGVPGGGKTVAAVRYAVRASAFWAHARIFASSTWETWQQLEAILLGAPHLAIDDVGIRTAPVAGERMGYILATRHELGRPTVCTTNFSPDRFGELVDGSVSDGAGRVLDRIREGGMWLNVPGPSRRGGSGASVSWIKRERAMLQLYSLVEGVVRGSEPEPSEHQELLDGLRELLGHDVITSTSMDVCEVLRRKLGVSRDAVRGEVENQRAVDGRIDAELDRLRRKWPSHRTRAALRGQEVGQ